jgi:hypothetical protein
MYFIVFSLLFTPLLLFAPLFPLVLARRAKILARGNARMLVVTGAASTHIITQTTDQGKNIIQSNTTQNEDKQKETAAEEVQTDNQKPTQQEPVKSIEPIQSTDIAISSNTAAPINQTHLKSESLNTVSDKVSDTASTSTPSISKPPITSSSFPLSSPTSSSSFTKPKGVQIPHFTPPAKVSQHCILQHMLHLQYHHHSHHRCSHSHCYICLAFLFSTLVYTSMCPC